VQQRRLDPTLLLLAFMAPLLVATSCKRPVQIPLVDPALPDGVEWIASISEDANGEFVSATGLVRRNSAGANYLMPPSDELHRAYFQVVGFTTDQIGPLFGPEIDEDALFAAHLQPAQAGDTRLPTPIWVNRFDAVNGAVAIGATPPQLTAAWVSCTEATRRRILVGPAKTGSSALAVCSVPTITQALSKAATQPDLRVVSLAPGTYTSTSGEVFPLTVRGVALVGAGADQTILRGQGTVDRTNAAGSGFFNGMYDATLLIGDATNGTTITGVSIEAVDAIPQQGVGVICDRGNATSPPDAPTAPNSWLQHVSISGAYRWGVLVTGIGNPPEATGCNLSVTGSTLTGMAESALWVSGTCGSSSHPSAYNWSALSFGGEAPGEGNVVSRVHGATSCDPPKPSAVGVRVWDCGQAAVIGNHFSYGDWGVTIVQHPHDEVYNRFTIVGNDFNNLNVAGVALGWVTRVEEFSGNSFREVRDPNHEGAALLMESTRGQAGDHFPRLVHARNNRFFRNDNAVIYRGARSGARSGDGCGMADIGVDVDVPSDWGTATDPGNNLFVCNGTPGHDFLFERAGTATISLVGNLWDRWPVAITADPNAAGEIYRPGPTPALDLSSGSVYSGACP
jgi:hypothetical protein